MPFIMHLLNDIDRTSRQETIALYEEKLNEADTKRWEMEDLVHSLEEKLRKQKRSISPATITRHASEAAQIDNEMLREQVVHFERKVSQLESQLDGAREAADREEQAMRVRIAKYKENDGTLRKDLSEARAEVDHRKRLEAAGKARLEELEEALRENAVALENARAEIEGLRADLAVREMCSFPERHHPNIIGFLRIWKVCKQVPRLRMAQRLTTMQLDVG